MTLEISYRRILNAFTPSQPVSDASRFVGRAREISLALEALQTDGQCLVVHGQAGLGKTSLVRQLQLIAEGDAELLSRLNLAHLALGVDELFTPIALSGGEGMASTEDLLRALQGRLAALAAPRRIQSIVVSSSIGTNDGDTTYAERIGAIRDILSKLHAETDRRTLIVLDELDRLTSTRGLASVIRELSSSEVTFVLVGIARGVTDLLEDHPSVGRQLSVVRLDPLTPGESADIVNHAVASIGGAIRFSSEGRKQLIALAGGYPWFVHGAGKLCLMAAWEDGRQEVVRADVTVSGRRFITERFAHVFEFDYERSVVGRGEAASALSYCAEAIPAKGLNRSDLLRALGDRGVRDPAGQLELLLEPPNAPLVPLGGTKSELIGFADPMLARFLLLREA